MNYRHAYHAGNFADVYKHSVLIALIETLKIKPTPFCYLETHAGKGLYSLLDPESQKTLEYVSGIQRIWEIEPKTQEIQFYAHLVARFNQQQLRYYPGSPLLVAALLRPEDRGILVELHPEEIQLLKTSLRHNRQLAIHQGEGYLALKAFLPPKEKRGLLLIDPPFEQQQEEFGSILNSLNLIHQRWRQGIVLIWYPIKHRHSIERFHQQLKNSPFEKILMAELLLFPDDNALKLNGSGLILLNAPWQFEQVIGSILLELKELLAIDPRFAKVNLGSLK